METNGKFFLGRLFDPQSGKNSADPLLYNPVDLTTHAVVVGMTGSGKTGLCINLLEEAALAGLPALVIDPKGDLTNLLLHFPGLAPQDFQPWIDANQARRQQQTVEQVAADTAAAWRSGLAEWGIGPERLLALKNAAHFAVYTPGSDAGIPVSILASLKAPGIPWEGNREVLREKISGTVTALLGLVGMDNIDPVRTREHILIANIFEHAWSQNKDLDLSELILQTQNPPFTRLGVFDVNTFFPEKDRFELAMLLNNILAAPAFQSWIEGQPLDIAGLLFAPDGRPRHSIFYIAHLSDTERMFFVTLLYAAVEGWMRTQTGSSALRALVYFDEIFGYLPPISNPPSKQPILRMLKQARAFGVGQVLVTQNPVDVDYKALSNAGTWLIGKLQTEQDKQRLLDGLESATPSGLDRAEYDQMISRLGKRIFLLHNVHEPHPVLFNSRWAMNYLAGPLTRVQIPALNQLEGAGAVLPAAPAAAPTPPAAAPTAQQTAQQTALQAALPGIAAAVPVSLDHPQAVPIAAPPEAVQNSPVQSSPAPAAPAQSGAPATASLGSLLPGSATRPTPPAGITEYFLPNNLTFSDAFRESGRPYPPESYSLGLLYRPVLLGQAEIRFYNPRYNLDYRLYKCVLVGSFDRRASVRWDNAVGAALNQAEFDQQPIAQARFAGLEPPLSDTRSMTGLQKEFLDWAFRGAQITLRSQPDLKLFAGPDISQADFRTRCAEAARQGRDAELHKVGSALDKKIEALSLKINREQRALDENETELSDRRMEELGTHAENILSLFGGRSRRLTTSLTKRRLTEQAKADVNNARQTLGEMQAQLKELEDQKAQTLAEINERWGKLAADITETTLTPYKKDVRLDLFGLAWLPFHLVNVGDDVVELPAFSAQRMSPA